METRKKQGRQPRSKKSKCKYMEGEVLWMCFCLHIKEKAIHIYMTTTMAFMCSRTRTRCLILPVIIL